MMTNQRSKDIIAGAIAGTVLGAVTALLLAPKSGRELRADIASGCQQVSERTQQIASAVSGKTQQLAKQVGTHTSEFIGKAKDVTAQAARQVKVWREGASGGDEETADASVSGGAASLEASIAAEEEQQPEPTAVR
ncbi:hypothetical protein SD70_31245 [Gordoniibacillus kamchatkensis]|uniref:YtxH domain-containing protein n=1 Tax=Gordoniibacillus kamchatkensis TaxID=1590651 RepID=A0ABR5A7L9_9BACL|nr:YtxH domain-containing protein [Paenibacillus sp. VKM B-2647]KIL36803.1 hypothetical protein SD70_31245 [Paenibacillus sp. VKM B-2647]